MNQLLLIAQSIVSVVLITSILFQQRGSSLGSAFGGTGASYTSRRGVEKHLFRITVASIVIFIILSVANFLV